MLILSNPAKAKRAVESLVVHHLRRVSNQACGLGKSRVSDLLPHATTNLRCIGGRFFVIPQ